MSDIHELIARFRRAGANIELGGGDRVRFKPGQTPLPPGLLDELKSRKAEVIVALGGSPVPSLRRADYVAVCAEFVGSRTILRHPGFACGRCGNRYDGHAEAGKASASSEALEFLAGLMQK
jgi:sulfur carrier protein ThiS